MTKDKQQPTMDEIADWLDEAKTCIFNAPSGVYLSIESKVYLIELYKERAAQVRAIAEQSKPLSGEAIADAWRFIRDDLKDARYPKGTFYPVTFSDMEQFARAIEKLHGIGD